MKGLFPIVAVTDSKSLRECVYTTTRPSEKKVRIDISFLRQTVEEGSVEEITWVPTDKQLADVLTQRGVDSGFILDTLSRGCLRLTV